MKFYIVKPEAGAKTNDNDFKIMKVNEVDEANFLQDYGHLVITSGRSIQEAIINFGELKKQE